MSSHASVQQPPILSLKAHVQGVRASPERRWRVGEKREAIVGLLFEWRRAWVPEEEARYGRRRNLLDDNPAAG